MFQRFHQKLKEREEGFTLIELLVVILIIAILAAIAIPVFLRQREKGWVAGSQSGLKNAATAAESAATSTGGDYTGMNLASLQNEGLKTASNVTISVGSPTDADEFCIVAVHGDLDSAHAWHTATYDSSNGEPLPADTCS